MKNYLFFICYYLLQFIKSVKIYKCARYINMPKQCLNQWIDICTYNYKKYMMEINAL